MDYAEGPRPKRFASIVRSHWCGNERRNRDRSGKSFEEVDRATVATRSNRAVGILIANYSGVAGATSRVAVSRSSRVAGARGLKGESNRRLANWNGPGCRERFSASRKIGLTTDASSCGTRSHNDVDCSLDLGRLTEAESG